MNNISSIIKVKDYIKSKGLTEEHIFKKILNLQNKRLEGYREYSMFNEEKTPSQYIYWNDRFNEYRFKDFSSGHEGDIIDYIAYKYFKGDKEKAKITIIKICEDIINNKEEIKLDNKNPNSIEYELRENKITKINEIKIKGYANRLYDDERDLYFIKELEINEDIIKEYGILTIRDKEETKFLYIDSDGTFAQIYNPYATDKKKKFYNISSYTLEKLPYGMKNIIVSKKPVKNIFICSSVKDMLCLNNHFYINYMPYNSAVTYLNERYIDEKSLPRIFNNYNIYIVFDGDKTGINLAEKIKKQNKRIRVVDVKQSFYEEGNIIFKDLADMQMKYKNLNKFRFDLLM